MAQDYGEGPDLLGYVSRIQGLLGLAFGLGPTPRFMLLTLVPPRILYQPSYILQVAEPKNPRIKRNDLLTVG